jgi:hypothetical protein
MTALDVRAGVGGVEKRLDEIIALLKELIATIEGTYNE